MRLRWRSLAVVAIVTAGVLTACSSSSSSSGANATPGNLRDVLDHVSDTAGTRQVLMYSRPKAAIAANGGSASAPAYARAVGWGDTLATSSVLFKKALSFDPNSAELAVNVGSPPRLPGWLIGLATAPDPKLLTKLGAKKSGSTYRFAADNAVNLNSPLIRAISSGDAIGFNLLDIDGTSLRYGASSAALALLDPKSATLGDDKAEAAVADCLSDPLAATITNAVRSTRISGFTSVGVGVIGRAGATPTDELCVAADSAGDASRIAASVRTALSTGSSNNRVPWSTLLKAAKVSVKGTTVRLTANPEEGHGGLLLLSVQQQDLPGF